jgi:tRNA(Ile)-lysidine synthase
MSRKKTAGDPLIEKVGATVRRYDLLPRGKTVGLAVSGGPDSVALLETLAELAPRRRCKLVVMHVNHGLRGRESAGDQRFVERLARRHGFAFRTMKIGYQRIVRRRGNLAGISEEVLRSARYMLLNAMAKEAGASVVALGHHRDDLAETVVMHFLRGSGPAGLGGFRPRAQLGGVTYIRPLYDCTRAEILGFCRRRALMWREDRTNRDKRWLRNRLRHELLPYLEKEYNPRLRDLLADNARWFQEDEDYFEARAREALGISRPKSHPPKSVPLDTLRALPPPVLARLFRVWVMAVTRRSLPPTGRQIEDLLGLIERPTSRGEVRCSGGVLFFARGDSLVCWQPPEPGERFARPEEDHLPTVQPGEVQPPLLRLPSAGLALPQTGGQEIGAADGQSGARIEIRRYDRRRQGRAFESALRRVRTETRATDLEQYFDADRIEGPLVLRNRRPGDRFHPMGALGSRRLKEFLIDFKTPAAMRDRLLLLCDAKRVLWVVGLRTADHTRLTAGTKNILRVRFNACLPAKGRHGNRSGRR